jgi:hypothetical protein
MEISEVADLLHETAEHHDAYEKTHEAHNWWDWYAAYFDTRQRGGDPDAAVKAADAYMDEVFHVMPL